MGNVNESILQSVEGDRAETFATGAVSDFDWKLDDIVQGLQKVRNESLTARNRLDRPTNLPSRGVLSRIIDSLTTVLFPNRMSSRKLTRESVDYFVGQQLDSVLRELTAQATLEFKFSTETPLSIQHLQSRSSHAIRDFASALPRIRQLLDTDIVAAFESDPAARSIDEVLACYPGVFAMIHHRLANRLFLVGLPLMARMISEIAHAKTGIDIHPGATIGEYFAIDHGTGIVIGQTSVIGKNVRLQQGVTLGGLTSETDRGIIKGMDRCYLPRHPIIEDNVILCAGAKLFGRITIGTNSVIGGNVWVTQSVPPNSRVVQANSITVSFAEGEGI